jgi:peptide chain release factor 1
LTEEREGFLSFQVSGEKANDIFGEEAGGHRWQRVPETERKGRVHTSTVTVAVLPIPDEVEFSLNPADLEITTTRGSGPGGQNRNKVESEVAILHKPSGLRVRYGSERSQHQNKQMALSILAARLSQQKTEQRVQSKNATRKQQVGSGQRGDKIRTVRTQDNQVKCDLTGRTISYAAYSKGNITFS